MNQLRIITHALAAGFLAVASFTSLVGCGGGGSSSTTNTQDSGTARVSIKWPETTRLIPAAANSVTVSFLRGASVVSSKTVARPDDGATTTVEFTGLPVQALTLRAQAFPTTTGAGIAQASASKTVTIVADTNTEFAITMASTIESITVSPSISNLGLGGTVTLTATPINVSGATVLVSDATTSWTSSNSSVATVSSAGVVTAVAAGTTTIRFTESESGVTGVATVNVSSGLGDVDVIIK